MKIGIDLGGSHIGVGVIDSKLKIVEKLEKRITSVEKKDIKKAIESYIIQNIKEFQKKYEITSIGIACPGTIRNEVIEKSVNLGIKEYDLIKELKKEIKNIPMNIRNDAKSAALAENKIGSFEVIEKI